MANKPDKEKAGQGLSGDLEAARAKVDVALKLLDSETADGIIGENTEELGILERGAQADLTLLWGMMQSCGLRKLAPAKKATAQSMLILTTLVHYAYALGMRRGRDSV
jgi:hypothetical protein